MRVAGYHDDARAVRLARVVQVFKRAFKQCQEDPRSRGMDLHNWLQSTHHDAQHSSAHAPGSTYLLCACIRTESTFDAAAALARSDPRQHPEGAPRLFRFPYGARQGAPPRLARVRERLLERHRVRLAQCT